MTFQATTAQTMPTTKISTDLTWILNYEIILYYFIYHFLLNCRIKEAKRKKNCVFGISLNRSWFRRNFKFLIQSVFSRILHENFNCFRGESKHRIWNIFNANFISKPFSSESLLKDWNRIPFSNSFRSALNTFTFWRANIKQNINLNPFNKLFEIQHRLFTQFFSNFNQNLRITFDKVYNNEFLFYSAFIFFFSSFFVLWNFSSMKILH